MARELGPRAVIVALVSFVIFRFAGCAAIDKTERGEKGKEGLVILFKEENPVTKETRWASESVVFRAVNNVPASSIPSVCSFYLLVAKRDKIYVGAAKRDYIVIPEILINDLLIASGTITPDGTVELKVLKEGESKVTLTTTSINITLTVSAWTTGSGVGCRVVL